jgi:hypothetical protein
MLYSYQISTHPWESLRLPIAPRKRGRPKENKGYFNSYHKQKKRKRAERNITDDLLDDEAAILNEEAEAIAKEEEMCQMEATTTALSAADLPIDEICKTDVSINSASFNDDPSAEL